MFLIATSLFLYNLGGSILEMGIEEELKAENKAETDIDETNFDKQIEPSTENNQIVQNETDQQKQNNSVEESNNASEKKDEVPPEPKQSIETAEKQAKPKEAPVTTKQIEELKHSVTVQDRVKASGLVLKRLDMEDIKKLMGMLDGGVTKEEKEQAKQIVYKEFTPEEIKEIKELYNKYTKKDTKK